MANSANEVEWLNFIKCSRPILDNMPLLIARGNHDGNDPASETILRQYGQITGKNFYYTYRENDAFFIILDTEIKGEEQAILGDELKWLKYQLDSATVESSIVHIFLFMHRPLYPQGLHKGENLHNADSLHQIFLRHKKIRAIFAGHDHMYNKYIKEGEIYITTGGAGGVLYSGYGGDYHHFTKVSFFRDTLQINIKTIGIFNEVVEDFNI
jgi:3',5'-cyclic AMP phosphodiesterase CpdA